MITSVDRKTEASRSQMMDLSGGFAPHPKDMHDPLCGRPLQIGKPFNVVQHVVQGNLDPGAGQADGSHQLPSHGRLAGKDMLNPSAYFGSAPVGGLLPLVERSIDLSFGVNVAAVALSSQRLFPIFRPVGGIPPEIGTGIGVIPQKIQPLAIVGAGIAQTVLASGTCPSGLRPRKRQND